MLICPLTDAPSKEKRGSMSLPSFIKRKDVATLTLPQNEGQIVINLMRGDAAGEWGKLPVGDAFYFHKPAGCGGALSPVVVTEKKVVLCCHTCNMRIDLVGKNGLRPQTIGELRDVLAYMVRNE